MFLCENYSFLALRAFFNPVYGSSEISFRGKKGKATKILKYPILKKFNVKQTDIHNDRLRGYRLKHIFDHKGNRIDFVPHSLHTNFF